MSITFGIILIFLMASVLLNNINVNNTDAFSGSWSAFERLVAPACQGRLAHAPIISYLLAILGVMIVPLLTSVFTNSLLSMEKKFNEGRINFRLRNHIVLIGDGDLAISVIKELVGNNVIKILTSGNVCELRQRLAIDFDDRKLDRIIILSGSTADERNLCRMDLADAKGLYVVGDDNSGNRDVCNLNTLECVVRVLKSIHTRKERLLGFVLFEHKSSMGIYQVASVNWEMEGLLDFLPLYSYGLWARKVLINRNVRVNEDNSDYLPLEGIYCLDGNSRKRVHLVIAGMDEMGLALALEAAHIAHYPNFVTKHIKTRITFIDDNADVVMKELMAEYRSLFDLSVWHYSEGIEARYGRLFNENDWKKYDGAGIGEDFLDIEWEFIKGGVFDNAVCDYLSEAAADTDNILTVAVCYDDAHQSVAASLSLPECVRDNASQILVYQKDGDSLIRNVSNGDKSCNGVFSKLRAFGTTTDTYVYEKNILTAAKMIHYVYSNSDRLSGSDMETILSVSENEINEMWNHASSSKTLAAAHWSNIYNAASLWTKIRNVSGGELVTGSLSEDKVETLLRVEHARWNMEQLLLGFRPVTKADLNKDIWRSEVCRELKRRMVHVDIRSFESLEKEDFDSIYYDRILTEAIPLINGYLEKTVCR